MKKACQKSTSISPSADTLYPSNLWYLIYSSTQLFLRQAKKQDSSCHIFKNFEGQKPQSPNSICLVVIKVPETDKESLLCISFQPGNVVPHPGLEILPTVVQGQRVSHWTTKVILIQIISTRDVIPAYTPYLPTSTLPTVLRHSSLRHRRHLQHPQVFLWILTNTCPPGNVSWAIAPFEDLSNCQSRGD